MGYWMVMALYDKGWYPCLASNPEIEGRSREAAEAFKQQLDACSKIEHRVVSTETAIEAEDIRLALVGLLKLADDAAKASKPAARIFDEHEPVMTLARALAKPPV